MASRIAGAEMGAVLGWMSTRVLGQYDMFVLEDEGDADQDLVYYVGPNILALEKRFGFPPREFRFWIALHEVTHRTQFTGVPWLREYFLELVSEMLGRGRPRPDAVVPGDRPGRRGRPHRQQPAGRRRRRLAVRDRRSRRPRWIASAG